MSSKILAVSLLLLIMLISPASAQSDPNERTLVFNYTGSSQSYTVPSGVQEINFTLEGAGGGDNGGGKNGGDGGLTNGTLNVNGGGQTLYLYVGGSPTNASDGAYRIVGGWNGGGWGDRDHHYAKGGGGGTDIRVGGTTCQDRIAVAGGGGGFSFGKNGGAGGGTTGADGGGSAGEGGTQSSGGNQGGSFCSGGSNKDASDGTGGGGGGWYGGGRGSFDDAGGGGSGHCNTTHTLISSCSTYRGGGGQGENYSIDEKHGNITLEYEIPGTPPNVTLENPADDALKASPVTFDYLPKCYDSGGCQSASLQFNYTDYLESNFLLGSKSDWNQGSYNDVLPGDNLSLATSGTDIFAVGYEVDVNDWTTVTYEKSYSNPVVVAMGQEGADVSGNAETSRPQIRNVGGGDFEVRVLADDGSVITQDVGWMLMEKGHHQIGGVEVEAGTYEVTGTSSQDVSYQQSFPSNTIMVDSPQELCDSGVPTTSRYTEGTMGSSTVQGVYWESYYGGTSLECSGFEAGYIATERGATLSDSEVSFESGMIQDCNADPDNGNWCSASYSNSYEQAPIVLGNPVEADGGDPTVLGIRNSDSTGFDGRPTEDTVGDSEQGHATDDLPWIAISRESGEFVPKGTYKSKLFKNTQDTEWVLNSVQSTVPSETSLDIDWGTNETGEWIYYDEAKNLPKARYIKIRGLFSTSNATKSPELKKINISALEPQEGFRDANTTTSVQNDTVNSISYDFSKLAGFKSNRFPIETDWNIELQQADGQVDSGARRNITLTGNNEPYVSSPNIGPDLKVPTGTTVNITANVSDSSLQQVELVLKNPVGTNVLSNVSMTNITQKPSLHYRSYTIPHDSSSNGTWEAKVYGSDSSGKVGVGETAFVSHIKSPDLNLDSPNKGETGKNPVNFSFTPKCYSDGGCSKAALYINKAKNSSKNLITDRSSEWQNGISFDNTSVVNGKLLLQPLSGPDLIENSGFERNDTSTWSTNSWEAQSSTVNSGSFAGASTNQGNHDSTAYAQKTIDVPVDTQIVFYWKVSSESSYDYGRFKIDGNTEISLSGNHGWQRESFPISKGSHTIRFEYDKDYSVNNNADTVWVDDVKLEETKYSSSGNYTSKTLDFGDEVYWNKSNITENIPTDTGTSVTYGTNKSGSWTYYNAISDLPKARFSRYKLNLETTNDTVSPNVDKVNITALESKRKLRSVYETGSIQGDNQNSIVKNVSDILVENELPNEFLWNIEVTQSDNQTVTGSKRSFKLYSTPDAEVDLESPKNGESANPVEFKFTPKCYSSGGCENASLYLDYTKNISSGWWNDDWEYRKPVTLSNSHSSDLAEFPANVTLDTSSLISQGKMQTNCADIRIIEKGSPKNYQVESCNSASTEIHFDTDIDADSTETDTYVYYGNSSVNNAESKIPTRIRNGRGQLGNFDYWCTHNGEGQGSGYDGFWGGEACDGVANGIDSTGDEYVGFKTISRAGNSDWDISPVSGKPVLSWGEDQDVLDGSDSGSAGYQGFMAYKGYNGSDAGTLGAKVPGGVDAHAWFHVDGQSCDNSESLSLYAGTQSEESGDAEGVIYGWFKGDGSKGVSGDTLINELHDSCAADSSTTSVISPTEGDYVYPYVEQYLRGGGDDGLAQIDDFYWSDSSGNPIDLGASTGSETSLSESKSPTSVWRSVNSTSSIVNGTTNSIAYDLTNLPDLDENALPSTFDWNVFVVQSDSQSSFASDNFSAEITNVVDISNVSVTLKGDYPSVIADGQDVNEGIYTNIGTPYIAMENESVIESVIGYGGLISVEYRNSSGKDRITVKKDFNGERFFLAANTGNHQQIESKEELINEEGFLEISEPSFTGEITPESTISSIVSYSQINITGQKTLIEPGSSVDLVVRNEGRNGNVVVSLNSD